MDFCCFVLFVVYLEEAKILSGLYYKGAEATSYNSENS